MADTALIYLAPGAFHQTLAEAPVLFQPHVDASPRKMTLTEALRALAGGRVALIVTSTEALVTQVELARKQARHLQRVLPYLLEEQMLDAPEALHFAVGKPVQGRYPVVALAKAPLGALLALCREHGVFPQTLRVDADLLADRAPLVIAVDDPCVVILRRDQALAVAPSQVETLLALHREQPGSLGASVSVADGVVDGGSLDNTEAPGALDGVSPRVTDEAIRLEDAATLCAWLREALAQEGGVEILQGPYAQRKRAADGPSPWAPWIPVLRLAAVVFVVALAALWVQQWRYSRAADASFQQAAQLYQSLFPDDRATAGLRRQFRARLVRLSSTDSGVANGGLFSMLPAVASTLSGSDIKPRRLQFDSRDGSLLLDLDAKQYSDLEKLQAALRKKGVQATIANYRNGANGITARLKVEQAG